VLIEVIVETVEDAREAEQGGAGRLELVRALDRGGLTPADVLVEAVVKTVRIPVRVMLRDSEPFELADRAELGRLHAAARAAHAAGAAGFVTGFLRCGVPDLAAVQEVLGPLDLPLTFHRAFEDAQDPLQAMTALSADARIDRLLTSGGGGTWDQRLARLRALRRAAPAHLAILPGGGLNAENLRALKADGFPEAHVGRAARDAGGRVRQILVAALLRL
jgi:copper homeostasis protein